jgi:hypothetical protein
MFSGVQSIATAGPWEGYEKKKIWLGPIRSIAISSPVHKSPASEEAGCNVARTLESA